MPYLGLGQLHPVTAPSGQEVSLTPEEEREIVKQALSARIMSGLTASADIRKSAINAIGNAIGFALGGLIMGLIVGKKR